MRGQLPKNGTGRSKSGTIEKRAGALDDLAVFVAVARHESFIAAARRLAMPTSSVSRAVARLEEELGVQLLRRTSRKVALTDEGRQLMLGAAPHVEGLEEALASTVDRRAELSGVVRVTAPSYTGATRVARALALFAAKHPRVSIELDASNVIHDLLRDGFDFAIRVGEDTSPDFVARRLWQNPFGLFAAPQFVRRELKGRTRLSREQVERGPCVVMRKTSRWRFRDDEERAFDVTPNARFAVNDPRAGVAVAKLGLGVVLAPLDGLAADAGLVQLTPDFGEPVPIDLFMVYPTRRLLPRRVRMAMDWLVDFAG